MQVQVIVKTCLFDIFQSSDLIKANELSFWLLWL